MSTYRPLDPLAEHELDGEILEMDFTEIEERVLAHLDLDISDLEDIYDVDL